MESSWGWAEASLLQRLPGDNGWGAASGAALGSLQIAQAPGIVLPWSLQRIPGPPCWLQCPKSHWLPPGLVGGLDSLGWPGWHPDPGRVWWRVSHHLERPGDSAATAGGQEELCPESWVRKENPKLCSRPPWGTRQGLGGSFPHCTLTLSVCVNSALLSWGPGAQDSWSRISDDPASSGEGKESPRISGERRPVPGIRPVWHMFDSGLLYRNSQCKERRTEGQRGVLEGQRKVTCSGTAGVGGMVFGHHTLALYPEAINPQAAQLLAPRCTGKLKTAAKQLRCPLQGPHAHTHTHRGAPLQWRLCHL